MCKGIAEAVTSQALKEDRLNHVMKVKKICGEGVEAEVRGVYMSIHFGFVAVAHMPPAQVTAVSDRKDPGMLPAA